MAVEWIDMVNDEAGKVYVDKTDGKIRYLVMRGPACLCGYIGIASDHPMAGKSYDDIDINVHGGLTYGTEGNGKQWPKWFYWYGWDYAHAGDYCFFYDTVDFFPMLHERTDKKWLVSDVEAEIISVLPAFRALMSHYEDIAGLNGMIPWFTSNMTILVGICQKILRKAWWASYNWFDRNMGKLETNSQILVTKLIAYFNDIKQRIWPE